MKLIVDVKENKAEFLLEVLRNFSFVKATPISEEKAKIISDLKEAVDEVKLAKEGKIQLQSAEDFLNEIED